MSINYYINLKNKYDLLIFSFNEIINIYEEMIFISDEEYISSNNLNNLNNLNEIKKDLIINDISNFTEMKKTYNKHKEFMLYQKEIINENIKIRCQHNFVEDTIDIDPDRCKVINYCEYCGTTKDL